MKKHIQQWAGFSLTALAIGAFCGVAQADISTVTTSTNIAWPSEPNAPFYSSTPLTGLSAQAQPGSATGAAASSLAETFTITNLAGVAAGTGPGAGTNYVLTGIAMVISGYSSAVPLTLHIYDVTPDLTAPSGQSIYNAAGATYNFTSPTQVGDLLGEDQGLQFFNDQQSGAEQVIYIGLQNGPNTYGDQVVLASNHTYSVEVSVPVGGQLYWFRNATADPGGQAMGSANAAPSAARTTLNALGLAGGAPRTFSLALYGTPTTLLTPSANASTNIIATTNYWIDEFNALSVLPVNPYYTNSGTDVDYSAGEIGDLWNNWFGDSSTTVTWDNTQDAEGNTNGGLGGSMLITMDFSQGTQLEVWFGANNVNPPLNGAALDFTSVECDVMFDSTSPVQTNYSGGVPGLVYFGNFQMGFRWPNYNQDYFDNGAAFQVPQALSNQWVHVKFPISALTDPYLDDISDILVHIYGPYGAGSPSQDLVGNLKMWVDNIKFKAPLALPLIPPSPLRIFPTTPGTARFFTSGPQYTRVELGTLDTSQSWIGSVSDTGNISAPFSQPVSYSFTLSTASTDPNIQTSIWLVQNDTTTYNGSDYTQPTELWLEILGAGANGVVGNVAWKANDPGANPTNTALQFTNATGVGTWTLTFTGETNGTLMAPRWVTASNFTIADPNVATDFANPLTAFFGVQNNGSTFGGFEDYTSISVTNVAGANELDVFANETAINTAIWSEANDVGTSSGYYQITNASFTSAYPATIEPIFVVTTNTPLWVSWNVTTNGYGLAESSTGTLPITSWVSPASFSGYTDVQLQCTVGSTNWALIPLDCLALTNQGYFVLVNPPPQN